jgi:hypothetical protein
LLEYTKKDEIRGSINKYGALMATFESGNLKPVKDLGELGVERRYVLKWILKKQNLSLWTCLI